MNKRVANTMTAAEIHAVIIPAFVEAESPELCVREFGRLWVLFGGRIVGGLREGCGVAVYSFVRFEVCVWIEVCVGRAVTVGEMIRPTLINMMYLSPFPA